MARIIVIDDNPTIRRALERLLERAGHDVRSAEDGDAGVRLWRGGGADLVITDLCMPGRTGLEVIVELRALAPGLALIAMSGGQESRSMDLLGTAGLGGALRLVPKPFTRDEILAAVNDALSPKPSSSHD